MSQQMLQYTCGVHRPSKLLRHTHWIACIGRGLVLTRDVLSTPTALHLLCCTYYTPTRWCANLLCLQAHTCLPPNAIQSTTMIRPKQEYPISFAKTSRVDYTLRQDHRPPTA